MKPAWIRMERTNEKKRRELDGARTKEWRELESHANKEWK